MLDTGVVLPGVAVRRVESLRLAETVLAVWRAGGQVTLFRGVIEEVEMIEAEDTQLPWWPAVVARTRFAAGVPPVGSVVFDREARLVGLVDAGLEEEALAWVQPAAVEERRS